MKKKYFLKLQNLFIIFLILKLQLKILISLLFFPFKNERNDI